MAKPRPKPEPEPEPPLAQIVYARIARIDNLDDKIRMLEEAARKEAARVGRDFRSLHRSCVDWSPYMNVSWYYA